MPDNSATKSIGAAIDEIVAALTSLPETARATAMKAACEHVGLVLGASAANSPIAPSFSALEAPAARPDTPATFAGPDDIRSLKESKNPGNNIEMACVMAFYLQTLAPTGERKGVFSGGDVEKYFAQAGFPLPKVPRQVLIDAKAAGYFDVVDRGTYKLNPVGYNLVVHSLPRKAGAPVKPRRTGQRTAAKKTGSGGRSK